jgi:CRISPR-associated endonuclease/helicase Cas3
VVARGEGRWGQHARAVTGALLGEQVLAATNAFDWDRPFGDAGFPTGFDAVVKTRLGAGDRIARFEPAVPSPFAGCIESLSIPAWFAEGAGSEAVPRDVDVSGPCVRFQFGARRFVYDRLGLRPEAASGPPHEEDAADA